MSDADKKDKKKDTKKDDDSDDDKKNKKPNEKKEALAAQSGGGAASSSRSELSMKEEAESCDPKRRIAKKSTGVSKPTKNFSGVEDVEENAGIEK